MGANQSNNGEMTSERDWPREVKSRKNRGNHSSASGHRSRMVDENRKNKGKPTPPQKPVVTDTTHNSISISWHPPRQATGNSVIAYTVEIASNSPSSGGDKHWKVLTKSCQSTSYEARHLETNTEYLFRVKAENVYGVGKPSPPTDIITTKIFETPPSHDRCIGVSSAGSENSDQSFKRRHSFNMHIDGGLSTILNHSDIVLNSKSSHSTSTLDRDRPERAQALQRHNGHRSSLQSSRKISLPILLPGTGTNSVNRLRESRNSLRTSSSDIPVGGLTLPKDASKSKFRDSRSSFGSTVSDMNCSTNSGSEDLKKKINGSKNSLVSSHSDITVSNSRDGCSTSGSKNSLCDYHDNGSLSSEKRHEHGGDTIHDKCLENNNNIAKDVDNSEPSNEDDDVHKLKEELKNFELTEERLKFHDSRENRNNLHNTLFSNSQTQNGYYKSLENPWERNLAADDVSENIMELPIFDDTKVSPRDQDMPDQCISLVESGYSDASQSQHGLGCASTNKEPEEQGNFRTLRSVLQSNNMIVKTCRPLPDVVGVVMGEGGEAKMLNRGKLTTIIEPDEEEEPVRVSTL